MSKELTRKFDHAHKELTGACGVTIEDVNAAGDCALTLLKKGGPSSHVVENLLARCKVSEDFLVCSLILVVQHVKTQAMHEIMGGMLGGGPGGFGDILRKLKEGMPKDDDE